jgi:hypothetical protein
MAGTLVLSRTNPLLPNLSPRRDQPLNLQLRSQPSLKMTKMMMKMTKTKMTRTKRSGLATNKTKMKMISTLMMMIKAHPKRRRRSDEFEYSYELLIIFSYLHK